MSETVRLTDEQREVVDCWGQGLAVTAGAGSGKTTTLVMKCRELLRKNPEARFAAVSFTERSASDLRKKLSKHLAIQGEGGALSGHWVMTIHGLCGAILREFPREAGLDGEETMLSEPEAQLYWERALESIWEDTLPEEINQALDHLLARESRDSLFDLLKRLRSLELFGVIHSLEKSQDPSSQALMRLGTHVLERYARLKRRRGVLDFNDLEQGADRVLENVNIRELFHRRFDLVLVDEFQDTNPVQARIIKRLIKPDQSNLCVVGDPKQSIYRFRDADVTVFEEFCASLARHVSLTFNFRSRPGIIETTNRICAPVFAASDLNYIPLKPGRRDDEETQGAESVVRLDVANPIELSQWILGQVNQGVPLHDMALLVRKIRGNEKWFKALSASGIPLAMGSGGLFWEDPRTRELVAFLKWWDFQYHSLSGATFLRAPWVGVTDQDLDEWVQKDRTWAEPFFASRYPIARALAPFRGKTVRPGELLLALLVSDEVEAELGAPLLGLWHRVEELSSRGLGFHAVVEELSLAASEKRRERDVPPPKNDGQLQVLTLHGAKGLEFKHVLLIDLGKKPRALPPPLLIWDREKGAFFLKRDESGERDKKDPESVAWLESEKKKSIAESKRLFYVALTRAMERLVLVCPELEDPLKGENILAEDYWRGWVELKGEGIAIEKKGGSLQRIIKKEEDAPRVTGRPVGFSKAERKIRPRHSVTEWNLLSRCPRAYEWTYIRPRLESPEGESDGVFSRAPDRDLEAEGQVISHRELGTRVHALLETRDFEGLQSLESEVGRERFLADPVIRWAETSSWMKPVQPGTREKVWTELSFEAALDGQVVVGAMDRLVRTSEGNYTVIDFKITQKEKSEAEILETYGTQMELYGWALRSLVSDSPVNNIDAHLVNISRESVRTFPVPLKGIDVEALKQAATRIVNGESGEPRPGRLCRVCPHRSRCPEGQS